MTVDEYWHGDVWLVEDFIKADKERQKRQNQEAWLQGLYIYDAMSCALANAFKKKSEQPAKYPEEPYQLFKDDLEEDIRLTEQQREEQEEQERLQARLYMQQMVWAGRDWGKGGQ